MDDGPGAFLALLGTESEGVPNEAGWLTARCPLAPWTHDGGVDSNPSFSVRWGSKAFNCFSCGSKGHLSHLMMLMQHHAKGGCPGLGAAWSLLLDSLEDQGGGSSLSLPGYSCQHGEVLDQVWPEDYLDDYPRAGHLPHHHPVRDYLEGRGVPFELWGHIGLRAVPEMGGSPGFGVGFPVRNWMGELVGFRVRRVNGDGTKYLAMKPPGFRNNSHVWYGEDRLDLNRPVVVVESVFDYLAVFPLYRNLLAPLTAIPSNAQMRRIRGLVRVGVMLDGDEAGKQGTMRILNQFGGSDVRCFASMLPAGTDPGSLGLDMLRKCLDSVLTNLEA